MMRGRFKTGRVQGCIQVLGCIRNAVLREDGRGLQIIVFVAETTIDAVVAVRGASRAVVARNRLKIAIGTKEGTMCVPRQEGASSTQARPFRTTQVSRGVRK